MSEYYDVILLAAGSATRFNYQSDRNKVLMPLKGRPVFDYSLSMFLSDPKCRNILFVTRETERPLFEEKTKDIYKEMPSKIIWVTGGKERQDSVSCALSDIRGDKSPAILVHDAARPFITRDLISRLLAGLSETPAVIPGIMAKDSMKLVKAAVVDQSLQRSAVRHIQTPQVFRTECLLEAVTRAEEERFYGNEEGELVERLGYQVSVVEGLEQNLKITTAMDYTFARFMVEQQQVDR